MKLNKFIYSIGMVVLSSLAYGQQIPQYSQFLRNQQLINPGVTGQKDYVDITLGGRMQWAGFANAPRTAFLMVSAPLSKKIAKPIYDPGIRVSSSIARNTVLKTPKLKHGIGGQVLMDQYGAFQRMYAGVNYAMHMPVSKKFKLSLGLKAGLSNNTFLSDRAVVLNPGIDNTYQSYIADGGNKFILDLGAGLYLYSDNLFVGIAADHLSKDAVKFGPNTANFNSQIHWNGILGYKIKLNDNLNLTPAVLIKMMNPAPISFDANLQLEYKDWLWGGVGFRNQDAVIGMVGVNINKRFKFGYSFDFAISKMRSYSKGGHEVILGIMLGK